MRIKKTRIRATVRGGQAVIGFLLGNVRSTSDVTKISAEIEEVLADHEIQLLVINFGSLKHMTSQLISKLIALNMSCSERKITLRVCNMNSDVEEAFKICNLHNVIPVFGTAEEALSA